MSNKTKKHKFVHPDPENTLQVANTKVKNNKKIIKSVAETTSNIAKDLKTSIITISLFIIALVVFYILNEKYNFLDLIKTLSNNLLFVT